MKIKEKKKVKEWRNYVVISNWILTLSNHKQQTNRRENKSVKDASLIKKKMQEGRKEDYRREQIENK